MRELDWPDHPEIAGGIPPTVVTGKSWAARQRKAAEIPYTGPLTLGAAIEAGWISRELAIASVKRWEQATGQTFLVVEPERRAMKPKPSTTSVTVPEEQAS